jgi:hypothetical protein
MVRSQVLILVTGLLLFTLATVIVGNKMRGNSDPVVAAVVPTLVVSNGRVPGFSDDPIFIYCQLPENKVELFRQIPTGLAFLYNFDLSAVLEAAPQTITAQINPKVTLTLTKEPLGRYFLTFQQDGDPKQVSYFGKYFTC